MQGFGDLFLDYQVTLHNAIIRREAIPYLQRTV
jgi:hypothetical protein